MMKTNFKRKAIAALVTASLVNNVHGAPTLPQVVAGQATFGQQGNVFSITNTPNTIINWQSFSVNAGEITRFVQQSSDSAVLNRILGQDPSRILGALQSNGHVYLINPNGIMFGKDAKVDVNGLVASTLNINNSDFLAGKKIFSGSGGTISNAGSINGSKIFLIAQNVENSGVITSPSGEVVLAAGHSVELVDSGNPDLHVVVSAPADQAINLGQIVANRVGIYGALVNQRGVVNATAAAMEGGKVVFKASGDTLLEAGSVTTGSDIKVLGERVGLTGNALIDASGETGGGSVLVGGDYQGRNAAVQNATMSYVGKDAVIRADATGAGNGGKVIVWADQSTQAYGSLSARGGANGGNGGFIETSGHVLDIDGIRVSAAAVRGAGGTWLLDPWDITLSNNSTLNAGLTGGVWNPQSNTSSTSNILISAITASLNAGSDVTINSGVNTSTGADTGALAGGNGNITISDPISWTGSRRLTLFAYKDINVGAAVSASAGDLELRTWHGNINQTAGLTLGSLSANADAGSVTLSNGGNSVANLAGSAGNGNFLFNNASALNVGTVNGISGLSAGAGTMTVSVTGGGLNVANNISGLDAVNLTVNNGALALTGSAAVITDANVVMSSTSGVSMAGTSSIHAKNTVSISATATDAPFSMAAGTTLDTGGGILSLSTDHMSLAGTITAGSGSVVLQPFNPSTAAKVGANAADAAGVLGLTDVELATISTSNVLIVKTTGSAPLDVAGALNLTTPGKLTGNLSLMTGSGTLTVDAASPLTVPNYLFMYSDGTLASNAAISAGSMMLEANKMTLAGGAITAPSGVQLVAPAAAIDLGSTNDGGAALALSGAELNLIAAPTLSIATNSGDLNVTGASVLAPSGVSGAISLNSAGSITVGSGAGLASAGSLNLAAYAGANPIITNGGTLQGTFVDLVSPKMALGGGAVIGSSSVALRGGTTTNIALGAVGDSTAGTLELSSAELNTITSPLLRISSPASGNIVVQSALTGATGGAFEHLTGTSTLSLQTPTGNISQSPGATIGGVSQLALYGATVNMTESNGTGVVAGRGTTAFNFRSTSTVAVQNVDGINGVTGGTVNLEAMGASPLIIGSAVSGSSVILTSGAAASTNTANVITFNALVTATGTIDINANSDAGTSIPTGTNVFPHLATTPVVVPPVTVPSTPPPPPPPTLNECISSPTTSGCAGVLPSLDLCTTTPATLGCTVVLPKLSTCISAPGTAGCIAVLPTIGQCTANPATSGCAVVLPTLATCVATPTAAGCSVVLPTLPTCIASPTATGCSVVLPTLQACIASPATAGCSVVLPSLPACIASPTTAGCSVVLPSLAQCVLTPTAAGCAVVLPKLPICIATPSTTGCTVVLPTMSTCIAAPATAGCSVVLPTLAACVATPSSTGCSVVLPTLSQCILTPAQNGCSVVLPTLAQCTASPTLQGCSVVLPALSSCAANPATPGCTAVLPAPAFCETHPQDASCKAIDNGAAPGPVAQAIQNTVSIINTVTDTESGGGGGGASDKKNDSATKTGPVAANTTGAKNEAPPKLYCN